MVKNTIQRFIEKINSVKYSDHQKNVGNVSYQVCLDAFIFTIQEHVAVFKIVPHSNFAFCFHES